MHHHASDLIPSPAAQGQANPILVEVMRGTVRESFHRGVVVASDDEGKILWSRGDPSQLAFPRSAAKPLQALPFVASGALAAFGLTNIEVALASGSHAGQEMHIKRLHRWLRTVGIEAKQLKCGPSAPLSGTAASALKAQGLSPTALHNNNSGKHLAILSTAKHLGEDLDGYLDPDHPAQRRIREVMSDLLGESLGAPTVDHCGMPTVAVPVAAFAAAYARLAVSWSGAKDYPGARRVLSAMVQHPEFVAGPGRLSTTLNELTGGEVIVKGGAEGIFAAAVPQRRMGLVVKIDDGSQRAADVALIQSLAMLDVFTATQRAALQERSNPKLKNQPGDIAGEIRASLL